MGEFFAEADVLIRPDTTKFRATLVAELEAATKGIVVPITVVASQKSVAAARQVTAATETVTRAKQKQAVADQTATKAAIDLAEAQRLGAVATAKLADIQDADALSVTAVAASKAKLRAAEAAVIAARKASAASLAVENAELQANAAAALESATAQLADARAAAAEAVAHAKSSQEVAAHAAAHHALAKGAAATGLSLVGARGATLAASSAFLAGAAAVTVFEHAIHEASAEQEAGARTVKVFGDNAEELEKDAKGLADSFGLSTRSALDFESKLGNLLENAKFTREESAGLSEELVKLAADLAAFNNVPVEQTLKAISLGLLGNSRALRNYQIDLTQTNVTQEALRISGKKSADDLTNEERIRARVNLILEQTARVQGAAADRAGNLAQQEKVLKANLENLGGTIGRAVIPPVTELVTDLGKLVGLLGKAGDEAETFAHKLDTSTSGRKKGLFSGIESFVTSSLPKQIEFFKNTIKNLDKEIKGTGDTIEDNAKLAELHFRGLHVAAEREFNNKQIDQFNEGILDVVANVEKLIRKSADVSFRNAIADVDRLDEKLTDVKIAGGSPSDQLAVLQREAEAQQRAVDAAATSAVATRGRSGHDTAVERRRQAKEDLLSTINEIRSIQKDQADAATQAAEDIAKSAKDAADHIQELLDEADQAFLTALGLKQGALDIRQQRVEATKSLADDVDFQNTLQKFLIAQIAAAKKTISDATLRAQTIQQLTASLVASQIAEKQLLAQQVQNRQQRRAQKFERDAESIDLDIELAQTNKNVRAEIAARERRIRLDQEREKSVKGDTLATKKLRNDIAQQRAAIKELKGEVDKRRKDLEALEFSFLQTQSGFAANLLSNLLPTGAVAGTVGGGSISTPTGGTQRLGDSGNVQRVGAGDFSRDVTRTAATSVGPRGASQGQMTVLIGIQRHMLTVMNRLVGQRAHPEATEHKIQTAASMDIIG